MPDKVENIRLQKIIMIIVYFGDWPWYFSYFLESCKYNSSISFVIFSNNDSIHQKLPDNVKFLDYSISQFNEDAAKILEFEIDVRHAYKICDFKPAFGLIFQKYISGFDFWGYCDIDLIFGNIRNFMTEELLTEFDIISARHDYLTGSFALYRNNYYMLNLFMHSKDYKKVFSDPRNYCFDETNYAFGPFFQGISYKNITSEVESMSHVVRRLEEEKKIKPYFEFQIVEGFAGNMLWESGKLIYRKEFEALFYNLVKLKHIYSEENQLNVKMPFRFRISKSKFYAKCYKQYAGFFRLII